MVKRVYYTPSREWGPAIKYTYIDSEGKMWVGNDEYESQVNYCPMTGEPAPVQMKSKDKPYTPCGGEILTCKLYDNE